VNPQGRLLATTSTSRFHPQGLAALLRAREQGICATTHCDAPVRHIDHITPHAQGGETSLDNGQGLCARCNHAKQAPGWRQTVTELDGRHTVETSTPTGHTYDSVAPRPPEPIRAWTPAVGMGDPSGGRTPRSRYTIGCHTIRRSGTIAYRPGPRRRAPRRTHKADISWAHGLGYAAVPCRRRASTVLGSRLLAG